MSQDHKKLVVVAVDKFPPPDMKSCSCAALRSARPRGLMGTHWEMSVSTRTTKAGRPQLRPNCVLPEPNVDTGRNPAESQTEARLGFCVILFILRSVSIFDENLLRVPRNKRTLPPQISVFRAPKSTRSSGFLAPTNDEAVYATRPRGVPGAA